jgi:hypothetical protein
MSNRKFSFHKQLKKGEAGEDFFIKSYNELNPHKSDIKEVDIFIDGNKTVELKSDSYDENDTENFFIELIGNTTNNKLGGPHLSQQNDVDWFVYHYVPNKTFYWFDVKELCDFIDKNQNDFQTKEVKNYGWSSIGLLIPRNRITHLLKRKDQF